MNASIIVNTCSLGPRAMEVTGSTTPSPHAWRAYALQHFILPSYIETGFEVIVVGEFRSGDGYTYIHSPSQYFGAIDALHQRQEAFEASSGDIIFHLHDDHFVEPKSWSEFRWKLWSEFRWRTSHVWAAVRFRRTASGVERLPNGFTDGYISGHAAAYRREVLESCPWSAVPKVHEWDIEHTKMLRAAGAHMMEDESFVAWDVEVQT